VNACLDHRPQILKVLGSESRLRILLALAKHVYAPYPVWLTVYQLAKETGLDRKVVRLHLPTLVSNQLVLTNHIEAYARYALNMGEGIPQDLVKLFDNAGLMDKQPKR
jgi:DNA-binding transcriptional ArsR family regulator